jgi:hypothetical protein
VKLLFVIKFATNKHASALTFSSSFMATFGQNHSKSLSPAEAHPEAQDIDALVECMAAIPCTCAEEITRAQAQQ